MIEQRRCIGESAAAEAAIRELLGMLGDDPERPGLRETPRRVRASLAQLTEGYAGDPGALLRSALLEEATGDLVMLRDVEFYSLCEHHLLPFFGTVQLAYIPDGRIVGLAALTRLVELFSRRLQVQERLTEQIADSLMEHLRPRGAAVLVEATHLCLLMRGEARGESRLTTTCLRGACAEAGPRAEFFALARGGA